MKQMTAVPHLTAVIVLVIIGIATLAAAAAATIAPLLSLIAAPANRPLYQGVLVPSKAWPVPVVISTLPIPILLLHPMRRSTPNQSQMPRSIFPTALTQREILYPNPKR